MMPSPTSSSAKPVFHDTATAEPRTEHDYARALRGKPHRILDIGHSRMAYWSFGRGPDLVLIHGWPLDAATFRRVLPKLAERFTCHLFDLPGIGQSVADAGAPTDFISHASSVRTAIDLLGLERYALLAHDSGGFVARVLAAEDPRVTKMVLGDTEIPGHTPAMIIAFAALAKTPFGPAVLKMMLGNGAIRRSALGFGGCFTRSDYVDGSFGELFVEPLVASKEAALAQLKPLRTLHAGTMDALVAAHPRIKIPVQLIWGTDDPFFPIEKARRMTSEFAGPVSFVEIPGAKVFPHEDRADEFVDHAVRFLSS